MTPHVFSILLFAVNWVFYFLFFIFKEHSKKGMDFYIALFLFIQSKNTVRVGLLYEEWQENCCCDKFKHLLYVAVTKVVAQQFIRNTLWLFWYLHAWPASRHPSHKCLMVACNAFLLNLWE